VPGWLDLIRLRNVFGGVSGVDCIELGVTPFEEDTGDGDDEPDVDHTHGPGEQFADSSSNCPVFNVVVREVNTYCASESIESKLRNIVDVKLSSAE
jgi:hypothetical protein